MEEGLSQRTLEVFLNNIVRIRLKSNGRYINSKLVGVSPDIVLEKSDGRRVAITRSEVIDCADVD